MQHLIRRSLYVLIAGFILICVAPATQAQDPVKVAPNNYKVLYEDDDMRVLRYDDQPGQFIPQHSHPEYVVYSLAPARRQFMPAPCTSKIVAKPASINIPVDTPLVKPPTRHCERNTGKTDTHLIVIEFKVASNPTPSASLHRRRAVRQARRTHR